MKKDYIEFDLTESSRFSLDEDIGTTNSSGEQEIKILFRIAISDEQAKSLKSEDIKFEEFGFDGDDGNMGEMIFTLYIKEDEVSFFKYWVTTYHVNEYFQILDLKIQSIESKNILEILTLYTYLEDDEEWDEEDWGEEDDFGEEDEFWNNSDEDEEYKFSLNIDEKKWRIKNKVSFIEDGVEKVRVIDLCGIQYGNPYGRFYTYSTYKLNASKGDIVFLDKYNRSDLVAISDIKAIEIDNLGFPISMIKPAYVLFEDKKVSDAKVLELIKFNDYKFEYESKMVKVNHQKVDLEFLSNSLINRTRINIVGVTKGKGKKIYYMGTNGYKLEIGDKVICGYPYDEFEGTVKESPKETRIQDLFVPLTRLSYIVSTNTNEKAVKNLSSEGLNINSSKGTNITQLNPNEQLNLDELEKKNLINEINEMDEQLTSLHSKRSKYLDNNNLFDILEKYKINDDDKYNKILNKCNELSTYTKDKKTLQSFDNSEKLNIVVINDNVINIAKRVFADDENIKCVILSHNTKVIRKEAFANCKALEEIFFPQSLEEIQEDAFVKCKKLHSINLHDNIKKYYKAFRDSGIKELETTNEKIWQSSFENCNSLTSINLDDGVLKVERDAFNTCINLEKVFIAKSVETIESNVFLNCKKLTLYCQHDNEPVGWDQDWNPSLRPIVWNANDMSGEPQQYKKIDKENQREKKFETLILNIFSKIDAKELDEAKELIEEAQKIEYFEYRIYIAQAEVSLMEDSTYLMTEYYVDTIYDRFSDEEICDRDKPYFNRLLKAKTIKNGLLLMQLLAIKCKLEHLKYFISNGADVNQKCDLGYSILDYACIESVGDEERRKEMIDYLISQGAYRLMTHPWDDESREHYTMTIEKSKHNAPQIPYDELLTSPADFYKFAKITYDDDKKTLSDFDSNAPIRVLIIPSSIKQWYTNLFCNLRYVEEIFVPENFTTISGTMFSNCAKLTKIVFAEGITEIKDQVLQNNVNLKEVYLPSTLESVTPQICENAAPECRVYINSSREAWNGGIKFSASVTAFYNTKYKDTSTTPASSTSKGCYIATAVYGSYNCPEVWVLRRYRDLTLNNTLAGRLFIKIYYKISPKLIKLFPKIKWLNKVSKYLLNRFVSKLKKRGYSEESYRD